MDGHENKEILDGCANEWIENRFFVEIYIDSNWTYIYIDRLYFIWTTSEKKTKKKNRFPRESIEHGPHHDH